jgi:hypothetical protein
LSETGAPAGKGLRRSKSAGAESGACSATNWTARRVS